MAEVVTGVALKVGLEIFSRVSPKGLAWVKSKLVGRDILIVGQPRAGKTSLVRYLQHGLFAEPDTERTREIKETAAFTVNMGRNESLKLQVRKVVDTVGQVSAAEHARLSKSYRPHVLILLIDMKGPWAGTNEHSELHPVRLTPA
jgi:GTPase SAR1 family protein